jgi:hypothetical protein
MQGCLCHRRSDEWPDRFLRNETVAIDRDTRPPPRETRFQNRREINESEADCALDGGLKF